MNPLPFGVEQESSGDAQVMQDVFSGFAGAVGTAVPAVCQFSTSGDGYGGLAFVSGWGAAGTAGGTKSPGLYALIGVVLLMGIVTKNSILLVD